MRAGEDIRGFTLLELSIVLFIIALVTGMALSSGINVVATARLSATKNKMAAIDQALMAFRTANDRLPCPGDLTIAPLAVNYGIEAATPGTCTGGTPAANHTGAGGAQKTAAEGALPAITLGLSPDFMVDGWGNQIRYAVDISYTALGAFSSQNLSCGAITVQDKNANARSTGAIYALVSHGSNGHGAYTKKGVTVNAGSVNASELVNCHCNSSGAATSYTPTYVQMQPTLDPANALDNFDDFVTYKEQWQMRTNWDAPPLPNFYIADNMNRRIRLVTPGTCTITTIAGNGSYTYNGDGIPARNAAITPISIAMDSFGNLYLADSSSARIRKITAATGIINTVAGNGTSCSPGTAACGDGGPATSASISANNIKVDSSGNIYIADSVANRVRKVTASTGIVTNIAGNGTQSYTSSDGGQATSVGLDPFDVAVDSSGNIYIADGNDPRIRKVTAATGIISTVAGTIGSTCSPTTAACGDGGPATNAKLNTPIGITVDSAGNIYYADFTSYRIRKINTSGTITTVAGNGTSCSPSTAACGDGGPATAAGLYLPLSVSVDNTGNIYISDYNQRVRMVNSSGIINTLAGNGTGGYNGDNISAIGAELYFPSGVAIAR